MSYRNPFEAISALLLGLILTISCSPIKPGGGSSTEAKSSAAGSKGNNSDSGNNEGANETPSENKEGGEDATTATGENSLPSSQNSNDTALTERYNFAAVCGPLFGMSNDDSGLREGRGDS